MRSAVERIAAFAAAARPEHLTNDIRRLFKRNILDSLGCAIAALRGQPFQALREQFEESPDSAAPVDSPGRRCCSPARQRPQQRR